MQESFLIFGDLGTILGDNPLQSTDYYIQRRPPSAPLKRNSDGGLTIWVYVCYALCLPMLIIQTAIVQKTLFFTPTRLSFISENQSVDHHSKPFRGRMKGTFMSSAKVLFLSENLAFPFNFQLI